MRNWLNISEIFNDAFCKESTRLYQPRERIFASELGYSYYNRYLEMTCTPISNPPNEIARRKFASGRMVEAFIVLCLKELGVLVSEEKPIKLLEGVDNLEVSGRLDAVIGGIFKEQEIESSLQHLAWLPFFELLVDASKKFAERYKEIEFERLGMEIKSCSSWTYARVEETNKPLHHHALQAFHYALHENIPFGVTYFDKDSARMQTKFVYPDDKELAKLYYEDITKMTYYIRNKICPPKDNLIEQDLNNLKCSTNFNVEYSKFLTHSYGFETKQAYRDEVTPKILKYNRVIKRVLDGEKLTEKNRLVLLEMKDSGLIIPEVIDIEIEIVSQKKQSKQKEIKELSGDIAQMFNNLKK